MKTKLKLFAICQLLTALGLSAHAQGTALTYQGRLNDGMNLANGNYDLRFAIFDALTVGTQQGNFITNSATGVSNGLFTVTLDFGNQFPGANRWLEIGVRTNGGGSFFTLNPRQELTPAPYAVYSSNAAQLGGQNANTFVAKSGDTMTGTLNLPAAGLVVGANQLVAAGGDRIGIGTASPNSQLSVAGGADFSGFVGINQVSPISGADVFAVSSPANSSYGGMYVNTATGGWPFYGYAQNGAAQAWTYLDASDGDKWKLYNGGVQMTVARNGNVNVAGSVYGGAGVQGTNGLGHGIRGDSAGNIAVLGINGGAGSDRNGNGGVYGASVTGYGIGGESDSGDGVFGFSTSGYAGHFVGNVRASGVIYGDGGVQGTNTYGHGLRGDSGGNIAVLGINGGATSDVGGSGGVYGISSIGFGIGGESTSGDGVLGSSQSGYAGHFYGKVRASGLIYSDSGVQGTNGVGHGIRGDSGGNIAVLGINGGASSDVGGNGGVYGISSIGFGIGGESRSGDGVIGSSQSGYAGHFYGRLTASDVISSSGGLSVIATRTGSWNNAIAYIENQNSGANTSPALRLVGNGSTADGVLSVSAQGTGLIARFGNVSTWVAALDANGNMSATSFNPTSDRNAKEHFEPVNPREMLDKVAALPITRWNFKTESATKHVGPMAQDFHAAFGIGPDDKHIATVDADGVALAAIQGLNQKLEATVKAKDAKIAELEGRLARLENLISAKQQN